MTVSQRVNAVEPAALQAALSQAGQRLEVSDYAGAMDVLLSVSDHVRQHPFLCNSLGYLHIQAGRPSGAVDWFNMALALSPDHAAAASGLGLALLETKAYAQAAQAYEQALALAPAEAENIYNYATALYGLDRLDACLQALDKAIDLKPDYVRAFVKRAQVLERQGHLVQAIQAAESVVRIAPQDHMSWKLLADLLYKKDVMLRAVSAYKRALAIQPGDLESLCNCGQALRQSGRTDEAETYAQKALALQPGHADAVVLLAYIAVDRGNTEKARDLFADVAARGPICTYGANRLPARFRASLLFSPLAGNTPFEDLLSNSDFDADVLLVLPGFHYEAAMLKEPGEVIINLVGDADLGRELIDLTTEIVEQANRPVINHPRLIATTDRQSIAARLADLPHAIMPATVHADSGSLRREAAEGRLAFPVIVRHAGTHGGEAMELIHDERELEAFLQEAGEQPLYKTDYVDYSSADGHFRKYRFIFVDDEILPYHLAIGDVWKVHHLSTRMAEVEWMREEEARFLDHSADVFGPKGMMVLDEIRRRIGLDYFGIDCALDRDGNVVIFEVNATMLIHFRNDGFEYKTPHVACIRDAFQAMVARKAGH